MRLVHWDSEAIQINEFNMHFIKGIPIKIPTFFHVKTSTHKKRDVFQILHVYNIPFWEENTWNPIKMEV